MNKDEFIKRLKDSLDIFNTNTIQDEISWYQNEFEKKLKDGLKEEAIIKSFGEISEIQNKIYIKHGLNPDKVIKKNNFIYKQFEELFQVIHHVIDEMGKNDFQNNIKIIFDLVLLFVFICLMKIPFILIRNLGDSLILYFDFPFVSDIWGIIVDLIYIVVAVLVFMNIFSKYFKNLKASKKNKIKGKELESINLEEKK